jgi:hypothetical protein
MENNIVNLLDDRDEFASVVKAQLDAKAFSAVDALKKELSADFLKDLEQNEPQRVEKD